MLLNLTALSSLLSQLSCSQGVPHSSLLLTLASGSVIASHSSPTLPPFPQPSLNDKDDEERIKMYAAVAVSTWVEREQDGAERTDGDEVLRVESEAQLAAQVLRKGLQPVS
ncbi:hypothetical protein MNV49_002082 [Pseudohyphozyma bogoriensis]|nr:hypothetical protein MNV49_002082 [Pseudohyphozyma bogoriensis]